MLILAPMRSEMDGYLPFLHQEIPLGHRALFTGAVEGFPIAVLRTGMGLTNTAAGLLAALPLVNPCAVLSQGTAGAHADWLKVGDIVCATRFLYGDSRKGEDPLPVETADGMVKYINAHSHFIALGEKYHLPLGPITSGYAWRTDERELAACHKNTGSLCEEMEDAAAAQICREWGVPHGSLRVISNNHLRPDGTYDITSAVKLQAFILSCIKNGELHL